jgi:hypothetical protein
MAPNRGGMPMKADPGILAQLVAWGRDVPGFTVEHARDGLVLSHAFIDGVPDRHGHFVPGVGVHDGRSVYLLAMDLAWLFWLDDCSLWGAAPSARQGGRHVPPRSKGTNQRLPVPR